jgi:predicted lysophospholipase L1 biosynthesis ABC-type transport system permease subunit
LARLSAAISLFCCCSRRDFLRFCAGCSSWCACVAAVLRQGLANLYRPGNQSAAVLAALGTGVMLILAVYLMQSQVLREIQETASPKLPNIFLVDVTTDEVPAIQAVLQEQPGVQKQLELMPTSAAALFRSTEFRWTS